MASTIQIKRGTGSAVPSGLADGELAINLDNGKLYFGSGSTSVNNFTFGELTAEKYIVSSSVLYITTSFSSGSTEFGNSADDTHTFTGNITASSNISASGDLMATDLTLGGTSRISSTVGTIQINDHLYVTSGQHITASGNISSSGNITSNTLTVDGLSNQGSEATAVMIDGSNIVGTRELGSNAFTSTTIGTTTNTLTVDDATLQLNSGTTFNGSAARTISVKDGGIDSDALAQNLILVDGGSNVIVQGSSETGFKIFSTHAATTRDVGLTLSASSNGQQYTLGLNRTNDSFVIAPSNVGTAPENAVFELDTTGNITASGDISASGDIIGNVVYVDNSIIHNGDTDTKIQFTSDDLIDINTGGSVRARIENDGVTSTGRLKVNSNITASGNISASGTIFTDTISSPINNLTLNSDIVTVAAGTDGDATLVISADTDNDTETDNARLWFKQDGDITEGAIQMTSNVLNIINNVNGLGGISFQTGTTNNTGTTDPTTGATEKMLIATDGTVTVYGDLKLDSTNALFGNSHLLIKYDGKVKIGAGNRDVEINPLTLSINGPISTPITASGNISSSGNIYANRFGNNLEIIDTNAVTTIAVDSAAGVGNSGLKINVDGVDKLDFQKDALPIKFNVHTLFDAPITASGNISSSGTISGQAGLLVHSKSNSTDGNAQGDVLYFGGGSGLTVGSVCHYNSSGNWELADADDNTKSDGLLGVALATAPSGGILLRGMVTLDHDPGAVGDALYLTTTAGDVSATAPSGNGNIVRIVGYCLDASNGQIWFNPDSTFVEVNA